MLLVIELKSFKLWRRDNTRRRIGTPKSWKEAKHFFITLLPPTTIPHHYMKPEKENNFFTWVRKNHVEEVKKGICMIGYFSLFFSRVKIEKVEMDRQIYPCSD